MKRTVLKEKIKILRKKRFTKIFNIQNEKF